jgi:hypothetical protein
MAICVCSSTQQHATTLRAAVHPPVVVCCFGAPTPSQSKLSYNKPTKCTSAYLAIARLPICVAAHAKNMLRQVHACVRQWSSAHAAKSRASDAPTIQMCRHQANRAICSESHSLNRTSSTRAPRVNLGVSRPRTFYRRAAARWSGRGRTAPPLLLLCIDSEFLL